MSVCLSVPCFVRDRIGSGVYGFYFLCGSVERGSLGVTMRGEKGSMWHSSYLFDLRLAFGFYFLRPGAVEEALAANYTVCIVGLSFHLIPFISA